MGTVQPTPAPTHAPTRAPDSPPPTDASPATAAPSPAETSPAQTVSPATTEPTQGATAWVELTDVTDGPSARSDHTWTLNEEGTAAYLFGGRTADGASDELWQFDLASETWSQTSTTSGPDARWGHTGTWVPGQGLVVWSGQSESGFFGDIWRFDPTTSAWEQLPTTGDVPEARYGSCASYGPDGRLWISHGFTEDDGRFADTRAYEFGSGEWTDMTPTGRVPLERCLHDCFWSADSQLVLYGGQTTGVPALGDAWAYDLETGDWTASADGAAPPRNLYAMAVGDAGAVVFGGESSGSFFLDDVWLLDPASLEMTAINVSPGPVGRAGATLIDDTIAGRLLLFGGQGETGLLADVWQIGR